MKDITPEALELVKEGAPQFIRSVEQAAKEGHGQSVHVSVGLEAFYDDPMLLYASLWYARTNLVEVRFLPFGDA